MAVSLFWVSAVAVSSNRIIAGQAEEFDGLDEGVSQNGAGKTALSCLPRSLPKSFTRTGRRLVVHLKKAVNRPADSQKARDGDTRIRPSNCERVLGKKVRHEISIRLDSWNSGWADCHLVSFESYALTAKRPKLGGAKAAALEVDSIHGQSQQRAGCSEAVFCGGL